MFVFFFSFHLDLGGRTGDGGRVGRHRIVDVVGVVPAAPSGAGGGHGHGGGGGGHDQRPQQQPVRHRRGSQSIHPSPV